MADPEIELPMTSSQLSLDANKTSPGISTIYPANRDSDDPTSNNTSDFEKYTEKSGNDEAEEIELEDIVHHYLTFETELPHPTTIYPSFEGQEQPPEPPDLVHYTSPFDWAPRRKNIIICISCLITALTAFTAGAYSPGVGQMTQEWHVSNVAALVGITTFTTGKKNPTLYLLVLILTNIHQALQ